MKRQIDLSNLLVFFFLTLIPVTSFSQEYSFRLYKKFMHFDFHDNVKDSIQWTKIYRKKDLEEAFQNNLDATSLYLNLPKIDSNNIALLENLNQFKQLKYLLISILGIEKIPNSVFKLDSLEGLFIYSSTLKEIPDSIGKLKKLRFLTFGVSNSIKKISKELFTLKNLEELSLSGFTRDAKIPNLFGDMPKLKKLTLFSMSEELPSTIENLKSLEFLVLDAPYRGKFPSGIYNLPNLKYLYISPEHQKELEGISKLSKLEMLHISGKPPTDEVFQLSQLKLLYLSSTYSRSPNLENLKNLQELEGLIIWSYHNLESGLEVIDQLNNLKFLSINNCDRLINIPNFTLPNLNYLQFYNNNALKNYPKKINNIEATLKDDWF